ncbi:Clan SC, family S33, methylesterase-like serine peptidase [Tritrichomonas foetus]|uniref:Clan SC, family S33, methylesterase-like serine peptidase n=1 Tax=Tritrichomonas foetus TaxID=1144522 RepID=A0A1J4K2N4_9EUKA|nr:Clan SC, family S33, methylesterase-like serine peptidase [Tritrichomonas foetus]|eukprot:OHT05459.1 Clan SC, family S33, methylesterase-like serine peptidase [Tritrichomonas foetus]
MSKKTHKMDLMGDARKAIEAVIRPPRRQYDLNSLPTTLYDNVNGKKYSRNPINFINQRNEKIVGSLYTESTRNVMEGGPCVIYLHGNISSQQEGIFLVPNFCPYGVTVYLFDFSGCGESEGDHITLGFNESQDLELLINNLIKNFNLGPFILWGRSMGASTALMTNSEKVVGCIIDSSFCKLNDVCLNIAKNFGIPKGIDNLVVWWLDLTIYDFVDLDFDNVKPIKAAKSDGKPPAIFGHAENDEIIPFSDAEKIFKVYSNKEKTLIKLPDGHNSERPNYWFKKCILFALEKLSVEIPKDFKYVKVNGMEKRAHFNSYQELIDFAKSHGGEDKALQSIPIESNLQCEIVDD